MPRVVIDRKNANLEDAGLSCPCGCFRKNNGEYVIDPNSCIDCGVCQTVAGEAILEDTEASEEDVNFNAENADKWEVVE